MATDMATDVELESVMACGMVQSEWAICFDGDGVSIISEDRSRLQGWIQVRRFHSTAAIRAASPPKTQTTVAVGNGSVVGRGTSAGGMTGRSVPSESWISTATGGLELGASCWLLDSSGATARCVLVQSLSLNGGSLLLGKKT